MSVWFDGSCKLECSLEKVADTIKKPGDYFVGIARLMPGLTSAELVEEGPDFATIKTNEGMMYRTSITRQIEQQSAVIEFDERYKAGSRVEAHSHILHEFTGTSEGVSLRIVVSNVTAPGFLGLMYRKFASASIGKAFLSTHKAYFSNAGINR